jgi:signal peptidase I
MLKLIRDNKGFVLFILGMAIFRTAVADWNPVPTGSMQPTILEGDVVLVNRLAYNLKVPLTDVIVARTGEPQRGDIATFTSPKDGVRLIKRIVALGGDTVAMKNGVLIVNGQPADYPEAVQGQVALESGRSISALRLVEVQGSSRRNIQQFPDVQSVRDFSAITLPSDSFFMMGDNRDNSLDSRFYGPVPRHLLIGRSSRILVSADILTNWNLRFERFGLGI